MRKSIYISFILIISYSCFSCVSYRKFEYVDIYSVNSLEGIYYNENKIISKGFNVFRKSEQEYFTENDIFKIKFSDSKTLSLSFLNHDGWKHISDYKGKYNKKNNTFDIWHSKKIYPFIVVTGYDFEKVRLGKDNEGNLVFNGGYDRMGIVLIMAGGDRNRYFDKVSPIDEEIFIPVSEGYKWGYKDLRENILIEAHFDSVTTFVKDIARVKLENKWGFLNKDGKMIVEPSLDFISKFQDELAYIKSDNKWGIVDSAGTIIAAPIYDSLYVTPNSVIHIKKEEKWGVMNKNGDILIPLKYKKIEPVKAYSSPCSYIYSEDNKVGFLSLDGYETVPAIFDMIKFNYSHEEFAVCYSGDKKGIVTCKGILYPAIFNHISFNLNDIRQSKKDLLRPFARVMLYEKEYMVDRCGYLYSLKFNVFKGFKSEIIYESKIHYTELIRDETE